MQNMSFFSNFKNHDNEKLLQNIKENEDNEDDLE